MTSPCQYCSKRYVGCHADCESYKAFDAANKARNEEKRHAYISGYERGKRIKQQVERNYRQGRKARKGK